MFLSSSQKFCAHCRCASLTFFFAPKVVAPHPSNTACRTCQRVPPECWNLSQLQAKLDAQSQDPDVPCVPTVKRFCRSGQGHVQVPLVPNSIPVELSIWLEERHAEMHDALMNRETPRVLELSSRLSQRGGDHRWQVFVSFEATTVPATSTAVGSASDLHRHRVVHRGCGTYPRAKLWW